MPYRFEPCVVSELYHIYNRSIAKEVIIRKNKDYQRFYDLLGYYRYGKPFICFSEYNRLTLEAKEICLTKLALTHKEEIDIVAFAIMPTHFHILLRQNNDKAISNFISRVQEGFAKYLNIKTKRTGSVFQAMFKSVHIENDDQLMHVVRYIHLNPVTSYLLDSPAQLENYPWTSFMDYMGKRNDSFISTGAVKDLYKNDKELKDFTYEQAEYQRILAYESKLFHDQDD